MAKKSNKQLIEKIAEAPATALESTIATTEKVANGLHSKETLEKGKRYWHALGPGLTTGASDDDPSGIATYSQTGARYGFQLIWLSVITFPLMSAVQEMCARIGLVTGRGLAGNIRLHFSKRVLYLCALLLFAANAVNIGANLGAMAQAAQLLKPDLNFGFMVVFFAIFSLGMQIFTPYVKYARYLKWLALVLFAYIISALMADINWGEVAKNAVVPTITFDKEQLLLICAILGTTISPYLFFWQTSQEVEEQVLSGQNTVAQRRGAKKEEIKRMRIDVWSGMLLSNIVMFFIIAACGAVLFSQGITEINSAADAAEALRPFAGDATYFLFSLGIIGTGLLSIPVLAGASSYAVSESFRWKQGLNKGLSEARAFYGVIIFSVLIGLGLNFVGIDPIDALIYAAVFNGLVAPIILALIVLISSNKKIMGPWTNKKSTTFVGWFITGVMAIAGCAAIVSFF